MLDQVGRGLHHAAAATGGAKPSAFTGKRHQLLMGALPTPQAQKPMGQNAAFQKRLELIFDKLGQACPSFLFGLGKEGLDVVLDDLVERGVFRSPVSPNSWIRQVSLPTTNRRS